MLGRFVLDLISGVSDTTHMDKVTDTRYAELLAKFGGRGK